MRRYRFPLEAIPFRRIAYGIICATLVADTILALVLAWLLARGGAP